FHLPVFNILSSVHVTVIQRSERCVESSAEKQLLFNHRWTPISTDNGNGFCPPIFTNKHQ
ncbi:MAG: hypothetical protein V3V10_07130, partial [Planctomycetota bacterium]